jgi:hypothetical protein
MQKNNRNQTALFLPQRALCRRPLLENCSSLSALPFQIQAFRNPHQQSALSPPKPQGTPAHAVRAGAWSGKMLASAAAKAQDAD